MAGTLLRLPIELRLMIYNYTYEVASEPVHPGYIDTSLKCHPRPYPASIPDFLTMVLSGQALPKTSPSHLLRLPRLFRTHPAICQEIYQLCDCFIAIRLLGVKAPGVADWERKEVCLVARMIERFYTAGNHRIILEIRMMNVYGVDISIRRMMPILQLLRTFSMPKFRVVADVTQAHPACPYRDWCPVCSQRVERVVRVVRLMIAVAEESREKGYSRDEMIASIIASGQLDQRELDY